MKLEDLEKMLSQNDDSFDPYDFAMDFGPKLIAVAKAAYEIYEYYGLQDSPSDASKNLKEALEGLEKE